MCKNAGYTFMNSVYDIQGVYAKSIFLDSAVTVTCKYGALSPNFFQGRTTWCAREYLNLFMQPRYTL